MDRIYVKGDNMATPEEIYEKLTDMAKKHWDTMTPEERYTTSKKLIKTLSKFNDFQPMMENVHEIRISIITEQDPDLAEQEIRKALMSIGYDVCQVEIEELPNE